MSDLHSETAAKPCAHPQCTCQVVPGAGFTRDGARYCSEQCADPDIQGCGHEGCPCGELV